MKESKANRIGNMELYNDENYLIVSINPNIYTLDVVHSASNKMLEEAFIVLDGNLEKEIVVKLRPKEENADIEELGRRFNNELITNAVHKFNTTKNGTAKDSITQQEIFTSLENKETGFVDDGFSKIEESLKKLEESSLDDPLGISQPWGETRVKAQSGQNPKENLSDNLIPIDKIKTK